MEAYYVDPDHLLGLPGFGPAALAEVGQMVETIEFDDIAEEIATEDAEAIETLEVEEMVQVEAAPAVAEEEPRPTPQQAWADEEELAKAERAALVARLSGQMESEAEETPAATEVAEPVAEVASEQHVRPVIDTPEEEFVEEEFVEGDDVDELIAHGEKKAKQRRRQLVFDEDLGQVVARRKRKPGRARDDWEDYVD
jgi:hypothetical protein